MVEHTVSKFLFSFTFKLLYFDSKTVRCLDKRGKKSQNFKKSVPLVLTLSTRIWERKQFNLADSKIN